MNKLKFKTIQIFFVIFILSVGFFPNNVISENQNISLSKLYDNLELNTDIFIQRVEHYLYLKINDNVDEFVVNYSFPPDYTYQTPILLEIFEDSTANILRYEIVDDLKKPNKLAKFTIGSAHKDEILLIHFTCWVLLINKDFSDIPSNVKIPEKKDIPEEYFIWLSSSDVVQKNRILIKYHAKKLGGYEGNLLDFTKNVSSFIKKHRYFLFVVQLNLKIFFSQDAITTLFINGENVGRSHLACALLRSSNIPSRVLLVNNDQGFWTQMHYMVEYYFPNYGWVLIDTTKGETPYDSNRQIINRICYPQDEDDTKKDYIIPFMKGEEKWLWINNDNIEPYYVDCDEGSKSQMFKEGQITTNSFVINQSFFKTQSVFHQYQKYLGKNLNQDDLEHLNKAIEYQKKAINEFIENGDIFEYLFYLDKSYDEYKLIQN